jgi:hypothetical protein
MDVEKTIAEIEWLECIFTLPDTRPLSMSDWKKENEAAQAQCPDNRAFRHNRTMKVAHHEKEA